jgi:hypothetical protein
MKLRQSLKPLRYFYYSGFATATWEKRFNKTEEEVVFHLRNNIFNNLPMTSLYACKEKDDLKKIVSKLININTLGLLEALDIAVRDEYIFFNFDFKSSQQKECQCFGLIYYNEIK